MSPVREFWSHTHVGLLHEILSIVLEGRAGGHNRRDGVVVLGRLGVLSPCAILFAFGLPMPFPRFVMTQMADISFDAALTGSILRQSPCQPVGKEEDGNSGV